MVWWRWSTYYLEGWLLTFTLYACSVHCHVLRAMPNKFKYHIEPSSPDRPRTVRGAYLYNLVDCIQACILRRDYGRARRAWAIFVSWACTMLSSYMCSYPDSMS